ncbi:hypothetical protein [Streptomyces mirabilis]|uniref:hypothetical protein n=1 Tax=Streptomyces mirabilis TaxID=68239 RepID=UPI003694D2E4
MPPLPTPCPPGLVPDATDVDAFNAAYRRAKQHQGFVAVEEQGRRWTVKADTLTAGPDRTIVDSTYDAIRAAVIRLIRSRQIRADSSAGPVYFVQYDVESERRARAGAAGWQPARPSP